MPARWRTATTQLQSVVVAACWRPMAGDEAGDFHDVIDLKDGRVAVVVGDAPGFGARAAAIAEDLRGELRHAFRLTDDITAVLARLDARMEATGDDFIATAACAVVDPVAGVLRVGNAGHLPILVTEGAGLDLLDGPSDPPLGVRSARRVVSRTIGRDTALFLYTDGLIERRGTALDESIATLIETGRTIGGADAWAAELARRATEEFGQPTDDATVVSVHLDRGAAGPAPAGGTEVHPRQEVLLQAYLDLRDLRAHSLREVVADLVHGLREHLDVRLEVVDVASPGTDTESAGVLATPTIVRLTPQPSVRAIGWFTSPADLARALQLPAPKENL